MNQPNKKFIAEEIEVFFNTPPAYTKKPPCPDGFFWRGEKHEILNLLSAWDDFARHGRFEQNMRPEHAARAVLKGSWGVGRFHFQIETREKRKFEIYYDRAPEKSADRSGHWFLLTEIIS